MKELSIEQKAKRYDLALERAKELLEVGLKDTRDKRVVLSFFPELVESEDEGICRKLIAFLKQCKAVYGDGFKQFGLDIDDALAWLEKQGEQKLLNKCMYSNDNYTDEERKVLCDGCDEDCKLKQKPAEWSEEDENRLNHIIQFLEDKDRWKDTERAFPIEEDVRWLQSLKDGYRPKSNWEWNEEDGKMIEAILDSIDDNIAASDYHDMETWLKTLKGRVLPQSKQDWKPSDEQMVALDGICSYIRNKADWEISQDMVSDLYKLSEQLKKLKE